MSITPYLDEFDADLEIKRVLAVTLEMARVSLGVTDDLADGIIAKQIIELARADERDVEVLCEAVLKTLRGHCSETNSELSKCLGSIACISRSAALNQSLFAGVKTGDCVTPHILLNRCRRRAADGAGGGASSPFRDRSADHIGQFNLSVCAGNARFWRWHRRDWHLG
jgi:hypothetical protein